RELAHSCRPRVGDFRPDTHQLQVPDLEPTGRILPGGDPLQQAVALLEDAAQPRERPRIPWLDLNQELIQKPAALLGPGLDQPEVIRPEEGDAEMPGKVARPAPGAVDLDGAVRSILIDRQRDGHLDPAA